VQLGGKAMVQADAMQELSLPAEVTHIAPTATIQSGVVNYEVKVELQSLEAVEQEQMPTTIPEDFQLREGLTVTVNIVVAQRNDVLLVPNGAITTQAWQTYVQVMSPDGVIEERSITTGIRNWQYTEVTDGLSEGEKVIMAQETTSTSTTSQQGQRPSGGFMPGMGRID